MEAQGIEPRTSCMRSRRSATELRPRRCKSYSYTRQMTFMTVLKNQRGRSKYPLPTRIELVTSRLTVGRSDQLS